jgi:hypothetical protein
VAVGGAGSVGMSVGARVECWYVGSDGKPEATSVLGEARLTGGVPQRWHRRRGAGGAV